METTITPLIDLLAAWQREARQLLAPMRPQPHPEGVLSSSDAHARSTAIRRFRWTVVPRESRKERFLWPTLAEHLRGGADEVVDELAARKHEFEQDLIRLRWADERGQHFDRQLETVIDRVQRYLALEQLLLPRIATEIPAGVQDRVAERLASSRGLAPVQPHPDFPSQPWAVALLAPVAAVLDRLRDRYSTTPG